MTAHTPTASLPGDAIQQLRKLGTSVWLDDLSRDRLRSGNLQEIIASKGIAGVTTNPAIFATAMGAGTAYDAQIADLAATETPQSTPSLLWLPMTFVKPAMRLPVFTKPRMVSMDASRSRLIPGWL